MAYKHVVNFREKFVYPIKETVNWYPGHMSTGIRKMQQKLKSVDCILEVHDARIPFSGRNYNFHNLLTAIKPHIMILNKMDLSELSYKSQILEKFKTENINNVIFTNCKNQNDEGIKRVSFSLFLLNIKIFICFKSNYTIMIIGIPNVGKSSVINALRNRYLHKDKATAVGSMPGITRSVLEKIKICERSLSENGDQYFKFHIHTHTIKEGLIDTDILADYLLFILNKHRNFSYMHYLGLEEPCDDIRIVLLKTAINLKATFIFKTSDGQKILKPNLKAAADYFLKGFRKGEFGRMLLDEDML
ncbi:mitochondrial GTPase 1-like [Centruroides sculpturatus]|uniref:mitochondrial GTPase 1-like n=1 Tax=Centruroides sculpturatus TaxID=218467 RepID=UPI000C6E64C2|nr:mitochondrial GTPase 1-like [Centruroides sculpturatus]